MNGGHTRVIIFTYCVAQMLSTIAALAQQPLQPYMPADQLAFENALANLNSLANAAIAAHNEGNSYRAEKLQKEFDADFEKIFVARNITGWLCKYEWLDDGSKVDTSFSDYIAVKCHGDKASYLLLAYKGEKTSRMLAEMTFGRVLGIGGDFFEDQKKLYHLQLNGLNFIGPIIYLPK